MWRLALNWAAVITFFSLPVLFLLIHMIAKSQGVELQKEDFGYLRNLQTNVTWLVFGLAGLRTFEQIQANGKRSEPQPPLKQVHMPGSTP